MSIVVSRFKIDIFHVIQSASQHYFIIQKEKEKTPLDNVLSPPYYYFIMINPMFMVVLFFLLSLKLRN